MGVVIELERKSVRHAVEQTVWAVQRDCAALHTLCNDGAYFFDTEVMEMRKAAYDLIAMADQVTANMKLGSK